MSHDKARPRTGTEELDKWRARYHVRTPEEELLYSFKGKRIVLIGTPGVGKSLLGKQLAQLLGGVYFPEYVQADLLNAYLNIDRKKYAFSFQVLMVRERLHTFINALREAQQGKAVIIDGPLACDNAFARILWKDGLISNEEYGLYQKIVDEALLGTEESQGLPPPDYLVYLDCSEATALKRIKKREEQDPRRTGEYEAYKKGRFLVRLRATFAEVLNDQPCLVFDYDEDNTDENDRVPRARLLEILGLIRDRTLLRQGIGLNGDE